MKITSLLFSLVLFATLSFGQTATDLFTNKAVAVSWLGVDFSHVKLVGDFSQFSGAGGQSSYSIRDKYFPAWNRLILDEMSKYDVKGMLRRKDLFVDIDMIMGVNDEADVDEMETYNPPKYTEKDLQQFVSEYDCEGKEGIGVLFLAECLNKTTVEAYYHFVAINLKTKQLIFHERLRSEPRGIGLRNYWAGSIFGVIDRIKDTRYKIWQKPYKK